MSSSNFNLLVGNCLNVLKTLPSESVQCCITSPPYFQQRDYNHVEQLGLEESPWDFLNNLNEVFKEVFRVLKNDGILWVNMGDSYSVSGKNGGVAQDKKWKQDSNKGSQIKPQLKIPEGLKRKELIGVPWRLAFKLQEFGWYLRTDIIWNKIAAMPESVADRPSRCNEYIFMMTKSDTYFYNKEAVMNTNSSGEKVALRNVWSVNKSMGFNDGESHYATYPEDLIIPCLLSSSKEGDIVLDPFSGSGTTGVVSLKNGRKYLGIELNESYAKMSRSRLLEEERKYNFSQGII